MTEPDDSFAMRVAELDIPRDAGRFLEASGFSRLYPPQQSAVEAGILDGQSLLVSAPTASGKTLIATLAIISHIARGRGGRAVYLSPLRALAAEKYAEFAALSGIDTSGPGWKREGNSDDNDDSSGGDANNRGGSGRHRPIRVARLTGERGGPSSNARGSAIRSADVIVATNEAMDAAMRRGHEWTDEIGLVIADEIHLIGDATRGPTLEMILTQLKGGGGGDSGGGDSGGGTRPQVIGLSATVSNDTEIADWLGCRLVKKDWRPVRLAEGVCDDDGVVMMNDGRRLDVDVAGAEGLAARLGALSVSEGGQSLIFTATRPSSRTAAIRASKLVGATLSPRDRRSLTRIASKIQGFPFLPPEPAARSSAPQPAAGAQKRRTKAPASPAAGGAADGAVVNSAAATAATALEKDLAALVSRGVAFHHAGLPDRLRAIVEDEFRKGAIRLIASTTTLAAGVNLPARRVIISTVSRYDARYGRNMPISVLEYKQLCGRAGRPQYDDYGEAIICSSSGDAYDLFDRYVEGEADPIESRITDQAAMRAHLLTVVVLNPGITDDGIRSFFLDTLAGFQSGDYVVEDAADEALAFLLENGMVVSKGGRYAATTLGKRTSSLYVDPVTASYLRGVVSDAPGNSSGSSGDDDDGAEPDGPGQASARRHTLGFLHAITCCDEFVPRQSLNKGHYPLADALLLGPRRLELLSPVCAEECSRGLLVLHDWISERTEKEIETALKTQAGDLHRMVENAAWLAYVMREMARHAGRRDVARELGILRARIRSGIREELVELAGVRGIGRVRARALYDAGIRNLSDLRTVSTARLATIRQIGPTVAASIRREADSRSKRR